MSAIKTVTATINGQTYTLTYNSTSKKYEATITAPSTTSWNVNSGHYYPVSIKATDNAGNVATLTDADATYGAKLKLRVKETVKPVITMTSIGSNAILTNNSPVITFTITDTGSGVNTSSVVLKVDNTAVTLAAPKAVTNGYEYSYTASGLSDGTHSITIDGNDNDGNSATTFTRAFTIDTVPPTLNVTAPANGLETNNKSCTVTGVTNDVTSSPVSVTIKLNGTDTGSVTVGSDGAFSKTITLAEGSNTIIITATDKAGKSTTVTKTVTVDTSVPVFTSVTVAPNPVNAGSTYTITVEVNS